MNRVIETHKTNVCNEAISVVAIDGPGPGNASHEYEVSWLNRAELNNILRLSFQNGPINEVGTNGITQEVLISICIDRLQSFQSGPYACRENALALTKLEEAMQWLYHRTRARVSRGVEGTHKV